jgi:hypothetical protein
MSLKTHMRVPLVTLLSLLAPAATYTQGTVPTFRVTAGRASYTLAGRDPVQGTTTNIPTLLVEVQLSFDAKKIAGRPLVMDAVPDARAILRSPIFSNFAFPGEPPTQFGDALLRATLPGHAGWHTLLAKPEINEGAPTLLRVAQRGIGIHSRRPSSGQITR